MRCGRCGWHTHGGFLRETARSVTSICYECGFEDVSDFYRAFRAAERASPDAWRRKLMAVNPAQVPR